MTKVKSDIQIARESHLKPIVEIGAALDIPATAIHQYGLYKGKLDFGFLNSLSSRPTCLLVWSSMS